MTPQEQRNKRLKNDYSQMVNIQGEIISWKAIKGEPPHVEEYELNLKIRGIIGNGPNYREEHKVKLVLPAGYPITAPNISMISSPVIFHPNWWKNSNWCFGTWNLSEGLGDHVIRMTKTIQYDKNITNEDSPTDQRDANSWYKTNKESGLFPCDNKSLPNPEKKKMTINPPTKKKFEIK